MTVPFAAALFLAWSAQGVSDDDVLRRLLASAATAERSGLEAAVSELADPELRRQALASLDEFRRAARLAARGRDLERELAELGGKVAWEPGGPAWLRARVGEAALKAVHRLVAVDLNDRTNPHFKDYRLNTRVNDAWLEKLEGLADLRTLDLANADLRGPGLRHLAALTSLESINLTLTPLSDESLAALAGLKRLRVLGLASTKIRGTGLKALAALPIENLNCHSTPVDDAGLAEIARLPRLKRLEIVHTQFTDEGARGLSDLSTLERLQIGSRKATGAALEALRELPNLAELDLHDGQPTLEGLRHAGRIPTLRVLRVYGGGAGDEGIRALSGLDRLETLVLESVGLTDAGLAFPPALRKLDLREPKVSASALDALRASRPALDLRRR